MTIYTATGELSDVSLQGDRILLNFVEPTVIQKTKKGIYTAHSPRESYDDAPPMVELHVQTTVAAIGPDVSNIALGQSVIHNIGNGIVVRIDDKEYFLTNAINIIAVVNPRVEEKELPEVSDNLKGPFKNVMYVNSEK